MAIPFLSTPDKAITATTQDFIPIIDISDGIILFKNGFAALILESTSLNFGLLSENEQAAVIASFAGIINSFSFPVQIVVRSQKKDISAYMRFLEGAGKKIANEKLQMLMQDYRKFVDDAIKKKNVLSKKFYFVVPFTPFELGVAKSIAVTFTPSKKVTALPYPKSYVLRKAKIALLPKRDHLIRQTARLGLRLKHLSTEELIKLAYNIYNPELPVKERDTFSPE